MTRVWRPEEKCDQSPRKSARILAKWSPADSRLRIAMRGEAVEAGRHFTR